VQINKPQGVKPKMGEQKLQSGVTYARVVKTKGHKIRPLHIFFLQK
jgi:hypothetical protein